MSNEKTDEFLSWRGRLEDVGGIPGQGLDDREAAWERLMDKIAETPRRRRFFGYRLAAACVLLAMLPAARFFYDRRVRVVAVRPAERQRVVSRGAMMPGQDAGVSDPRGAGLAPREAGVSDIPDVAPVREGVAGVRKELRPKREQRPVEIARLAETAGDMPATAPLTIPDSAATMPLNTLKSRPLRVVHINELSGGAGPYPAVTVTETRRHFQIILAPWQGRMALPPGPAPATMSAEATDPAILKVKLTSPN